MSKNNFMVILKPDAIKRKLVGTIISAFEEKGFNLARMNYLRYTGQDISADDTNELYGNVPRSELLSVVEKHYEMHAKENFYEKLIEFTMSGPIVIMIWRGNIEVARNLIGSTNPKSHSPFTIRGKFSNSLPENLVHVSDSPENAKREIELWRKYFYERSI